MTYYTYIRDNIVGCVAGTCGINAQCITVTGGRPVCACLSGYAGDPLTQCRKVECTGKLLNIYDNKFNFELKMYLLSSLDHSDCGGNLACQNEKCVNPCAGVCGVNADCTVIIYNIK